MSDVPTESKPSEKKTSSASRWKQRVAYFSAGLTIAATCSLLRWLRMDLAPFDALPWLKSSRHLVRWLPWIAVILVIVLRVVNGKRVRVFSFCCGAATPYVVLVGYLIFSPLIEDRMHRTTFDAKLWRDEDSAKRDVMWPPRLCMVDDLMASGRLNGLTSNQVVTLLGLPLAEEFSGKRAESEVHYYLGPDRGSFFRFGSEWLYVSFGTGGKVATCRLDQVQD